jgi:hypothetical protein
VRYEIITKHLLLFAPHSHSDVTRTIKYFNTKFHAMQHYIDAIRSLGSADGYNTEFSERLHIDYAKQGYRASNKRDYIEQMALWLQHQEAIDFHSGYLDWIHRKIDTLPLPADDEFDENEDLSENGDDDDIVPDEDGPVYHIAKTCPQPHLPINSLVTDFGAVDFLPALTAFLKKNLPPRNFLQPGAMDRFDVYNQISLDLPPNPYLSSEPLHTRIRATAALPAHGRKLGTSAHFDTALVIDHQDDGSPGKFCSESLLKLFSMVPRADSNSSQHFELHRCGCCSSYLHSLERSLTLSRTLSGSRHCVTQNRLLGCTRFLNLREIITVMLL